MMFDLPVVTKGGGPRSLEADIQGGGNAVAR